MKSGWLAPRMDMQPSRIRVTHCSLLAILFSASPVNLRLRGGSIWAENLTHHFASRPLASMLNVSMCALWIWKKYEVLWFLPASVREMTGVKYSSTPSKTIFLDKIRGWYLLRLPTQVLEGYAEKKLMSHRVGNTTKRVRSYIFFFWRCLATFQLRPQDQNVL